MRTFGGKTPKQNTIRRVKRKKVRKKSEPAQIRKTDETGPVADISACDCPRIALSVGSGRKDRRVKTKRDSVGRK